MFRNLKIGTRLGLGFGLLLALMLVSSAVGISQLSAMNGTIVRVIERDATKAYLAFEIEREVSLGRIAFDDAHDCPVHRRELADPHRA